MNINWSDAFYHAENSPRAVLAEFIEGADDIQSLVIIVARKSETGMDEYTYRTSGSAFMSLGLVATVHADLLKHCGGEE